MQNFSSLAGLEVTEKFGVGWVGWGGVGWMGLGGFQVSTISNPTKWLLQLLWVELSWVTLGFDNFIKLWMRKLRGNQSINAMRLKEAV